MGWQVSHVEAPAGTEDRGAITVATSHSVQRIGTILRPTVAARWIFLGARAVVQSGSRSIPGALLGALLPRFQAREDDAFSEPEALRHFPLVQTQRQLHRRATGGTNREKHVYRMRSDGGRPWAPTDASACPIDAQQRGRFTARPVGRLTYRNSCICSRAHLLTHV